LQASQVPAQAVLQQVLSAQKPVAHWPAEVQAWPAPLFHTQVPAWQVEPGLQSAFPAQAPRQLPTAPLQKVLPHSVVGSCPAATTLQVPALPARLHAWQVSPHAPSQHTPSAQKPEAQAVPATQAWPSAFFGAQVPALQKLPDLQSASPVQGEMQDATLPRHSPKPQSPAGSVFAGTAVQAPTAPRRLHAWHAPPHAPSQHTPSAQNPEAHWAGITQACPLFRSARHWPPLQ